MLRRRYRTFSPSASHSSLPLTSFVSSFLSSQCDRDLRRRIRKVPGVPLMYIVSRRYQVERLPDGGVSPAFPFVPLRRVVPLRQRARRPMFSSSTAFVATTHTLTFSLFFSFALSPSGRQLGSLVSSRFVSFLRRPFASPSGGSVLLFLCFIILRQSSSNQFLSCSRSHVR